MNTKPKMTFTLAGELVSDAAHAKRILVDAIHKDNNVISSIHAAIKIKLEQGGFDGLYVAGECGCLNDDLAPCGSCEKDDAGWINDCEPGYRHNDPRPGHKVDWAISRSKEPMTADDFAIVGY